MSQYKTLGKNMGWLLIGNFASKALNFLLIPLYTNYLSTNDYGEADIVYTTISLLLPVLTLSIGEAVLRFSLDQDCKGDNKFKQKVFSIGLYITIISFLILVVITPLLRHFSVLNKYYSFFVIYYVVQSIYVVLAQFAKGIDSVFAFSLWGIINTLITAALNVLFILIFSFGIEGYFSAFIIGQLVSDIGLFFHLKAYRYLVILNKQDHLLINNMLLYALPLIPNSISWWISNSSDRYMINWFCGSSETGIYSVATKIPAFITVVFSMFIMAWQISSVEDFGSKKSVRFFSSVNKNYIVLCLVMASAIIAFIKPIARLLFANDFFIAWKVAPVLIIACCFHSLALFLGTIYTGAKKTNKVLFSTICAAILNIVLNALMLKWIGIMGAAIATLVSYLFLWLYRVVDTREIMKIEYGNWTVLISIILLFGQCIVMCMDYKYSMFVSTIVFISICILNYGFFNSFYNLIKITVKSVRRGG